ncbi:MAG: PAS domain-containing protein [Gemmatimonadetes bacterium]|nr:PAS domain-containing protein [Gemmatimonadota bacterium]
MSLDTLGVRPESQEREQAEVGPPPWPFGVPRDLSTGDLLRWLYAGRLTLVACVLGGALWLWRDLHPGDTFFATLIFLLAALATAGSYWWTHLARRPVTPSFSYGQAALDAAIVTGVVHLTGSVESPLTPLYILVIASGSLILPLSGGVLIGGLTSALFVAEAVFFNHGGIPGTVALQVALFGTVAVTVGLVADRLRKGGSQLGALESELRQLRLDTGDILNNIRSGILTVDEQGRLIYINPMGLSMLGRDLDAFRGRPVLERLDRLAPGLGEMIGRSIRDRTPVARFRTATLDPSPLTLGVSTTVLERESPGPNPVTAIFQDITDVERLEESNRRNERLGAVAALSASLAHEIKNPLASIQSAVEQLASGRVAAGDERVLRNLIVGQSQRLSRLLSEFIDFSGLEMGPRSDFDVGPLVDEALGLVRQHPEVQEVKYRVHRQGAAPVWGDRDLLHRALFNLLLNAGQFAGDGGTVLVEVSVLNHDGIDLSGEGGYAVRVSIEDDGPGIDANDLGRIFDPFYTKRKGGSGLGLAVVHRTVEAHDGSVYVEPVADGGARFVLLLPGRRQTS